MNILYVTNYEKEKINISGNAKNIIEQVCVRDIDYIESCLLCFEYSLIIFEDYLFYNKNELLQSFKYITERQKNATILFDVDNLDKVYMLDLYMQIDKQKENNNLFKAFNKTKTPAETIIKEHVKKLKKQEIQIGDNFLTIINKGQTIKCNFQSNKASIKWDIEFSNSNEADLFMILCNANKFKDKETLMDFLYAHQHSDTKKLQLLISKIRQSLKNIGVSDFFKLENKRNEGYDIQINSNSNIIENLFQKFGLNNQKHNNQPNLFDFYNVQL